MLTILFIPHNIQISLIVPVYALYSWLLWSLCSGRQQARQGIYFSGFFNLEQFPSISLFFLTLAFLKRLGQLFGITDPNLDFSSDFSCLVSGYILLTGLQNDVSLHFYQDAHFVHVFLIGDIKFDYLVKAVSLLFFFFPYN